MDYERYYEPRLPDARELFNKRQLTSFIEACFKTAFEKWSGNYTFFEERLQLKRGFLKKIPNLLVTTLEFEELRKYEKIFHAFLEVSEIDFDKILHEHRELFEQFPGYKDYSLYFIFDSRMIRYSTSISYHDKSLSISNVDDNDMMFDIIDHQEVTIITKDKEKRRILLDRPIHERLDELVCGIENHYGTDGTLIDSNKVLFLDQKIQPSKLELENICLFLANKDAQNSIYSQDIIIFSPFLKEVEEYRINNSWHKIMMPKYMVDSWIQYLNYFRTWIKQSKGISLTVQFIEEQEFIIVKLCSKKHLSNHILGEWFSEYINFLNRNTDPMDTEFKVHKSSRSIIVKKLQQQIATFETDIALTELLENKDIEILKEVSSTLSEVSSPNRSLLIQIINGGNNQIAKEIVNVQKLIE